MADQRSSSTSFTYNVFISYFGGEDTRTTFASHLWHSLTKKGIHTFMDDHLTLLRGTMSPELHKVIQESTIAIIVLSKKYVKTPPCLEELAFIVDTFQKKHDNRFIFPVFYNIDPSSVQEQSGPCAEAFARHEERFEDNKEKVQKWRKVLSHVATLSDWHFNDRDVIQSELINKIVEVVSKKLDHVPLHIGTWHIVSQTSSRVFQTLLNLKRFFNADKIWRLVGLVSSVIGLFCYALSPSFNRLVGRWNTLIFFLYGAISVGILTTICFANEFSLSTQYDRHIKTCTIFSVVLIISVYSFFYDRAVDGKPDIMSVVSNAAFGLVSLSLHKLFKLKSEIGVFSYFLCCFTVQLLTINRMLIFVAIIFGFLLSFIHSSQNSIPDVASGHQVVQV